MNDNMYSNGIHFRLGFIFEQRYFTFDLEWIFFLPNEEVKDDRLDEKTFGYKI